MDERDPTAAAGGAPGGAPRDGSGGASDRHSGGAAWPPGASGELDDRALGELDPRPGQRVLDAGCGAGGFALRCARAVGPEGRVLGVEADGALLAVARAAARAAGAPASLDLRRGDPAEPPLREDERESFDVLCARFLLGRRPAPERIVRALLGAVRPGGRVVLCEEDAGALQLWPELPALEACRAAWLAQRERGGGDPGVGRRLPELLHAAGAIPVRATILPWSGCFGQPGWPGLVRSLNGLLDAAAEALADAGEPDASGIRMARSELRTWAGHPGASIWYGLRWAEARRPGFGPGEVARRSGLP